MRKIFLTFLSFIICFLSHSQDQQFPKFEKAVEALKSKNYEEAIKLFSQVIPETKDNGIKKFSYIYRAFAYNGIEEFDKSVSDLDSAVIIDPNDIATYIDRGKSKGHKNDLEGAKKDFQFVLTKDSTSEQGQAALFYLGSIAYQERDFKKSIDWYTKFIQVNPKDAEVYFNRGAAKGMLLPMDLEGAIEDYDKAIKLEPDYAEAYANRGTAKINLLTTKGIIQPTKKQTESACSDFKRAKSLGDDSVDDMIFIYCDKK